MLEVIEFVGVRESSKVINECVNSLAKLRILAEVLSKQLLFIGNGKMPIDASTSFIPLPQDFCQFTSSREELITKVFLNIGVNYKIPKIITTITIHRFIALIALLDFSVALKILFI